MLKFDTKLGLYCEDTDSVRKEVQDVFISAFGEGLDVGAESPQGQIIDSITAMIVERDSALLAIANQLDPYKSEGIYQDAIGHIYFLERKKASKTSVLCTCYGLKNTFIPKSSIAKSIDNILFYSVDDAIIGENGSVEVYFECENEGEIAVQVGDINKIITVISGFDEIFNNYSGIMGNLEETRQEFESRRALSVAKNSEGSINAINAEIASIESIIDFLLLENATNTMQHINGVDIDPHSLYICVLGGSEEEIAKAIFNKKDIGCATSYNNEENISITHVDNESKASYTYNILRPKPLNIYIKLQINAKENGIYEDNSTIKEDLLANFYGKSLDSMENHQRIRIGEKLLATRFYYALLSQNRKELMSLKISRDSIDFSDEIQISAKEFPQLLEENIFIEKI